ncbi:hypothetical protein [Methylobacterium sp. J-090]|uniref:hypothetical protein n=1 Tax=Methylobacterium sp. J-090 TaxID=2836666 RepID=UPI002443D306|nr:hypothetical protein [Methylobacterium sp. J-090]
MVPPLLGNLIHSIAVAAAAAAAKAVTELLIEAVGLSGFQDPTVVGPEAKAATPLERTADTAAMAAMAEQVVTSPFQLSSIFRPLVV